MRRFASMTLALGLAVAMGLPTAAPAAAQGQGQGQGRGACFQQGAGGLQLAPSGGTRQGSAPQAGAATLGGLIDVVVQNTQLLNNVSALNETLNNAVSQNNLQLVCLNDTLNGNQVNVLSDILNSSEVLSHNRDVLSNILNNNEVIKNALNNTAVPVAVNVLGGGAQTGPVTLYVFNPR
ncbi:MAG: hypothetical protein IRZ14_06235 [Chloroflexi bacterium]|nr:hypothetical protein [Chloroflexota bacterium]